MWARTQLGDTFNITLMSLTLKILIVADGKTMWAPASLIVSTALQISQGVGLAGDPARFIAVRLWL
jgi:hypothetical protein